MRKKNREKSEIPIYLKNEHLAILQQPQTVNLWNGGVGIEWAQHVNQSAGGADVKNANLEEKR